MSLVEKWIRENPEYSEMNQLAKDAGYSDLNEFLIKRRERIKNELDAKIIDDSVN